MESLFTSRRTRAVVALVSALLLLSAATVAVTSPLPLQAIGRTQIMPTVKAPITAAAGHALVGGMAIAAGTSGSFRTRCSAANTAITYRL